MLAVAQFMLILDITVVTVALPDIGSDLALSRAATTWVITAYTLLFGGLMIFGGRAADLFGARRMAMIGLAAFTGSSLLAGLAVNAPLLIGGRIGQGIGAALLSPAAMSIVTTIFHGAERNKALGVWARSVAPAPLWACLPVGCCRRDRAGNGSSSSMCRWVSYCSPR